MLLSPTPKREEGRNYHIRKFGITKRTNSKYTTFLKSLDSNAQLIIIIKKQYQAVWEKLANEGRVSFNPFLCQKELAAEYEFFGNILGYIDCGLDQLMAQLKFESSFIDQKALIPSKEYRELQEQYTELATRRANIVKDYQEIIEDSSLEVIDESVAEYPGYAKFADILASNVTNRLQLPLQNEYVKAYNEGYMINRDGLESEKVYSKYETNIARIKEEIANKLKVYKN